MAASHRCRFARETKTTHREKSVRRRAGKSTRHPHRAGLQRREVRQQGPEGLVLRPLLPAAAAAAGPHAREALGRRRGLELERAEVVLLAPLRGCGWEGEKVRQQQSEGDRDGCGLLQSRRL